jgi:hypothetical protein
MFLPEIKSVDDLSDDNIAYLSGIANTLSTNNDDFSIQNFGDTAITNPQAKTALQSDAARAFVQGAEPYNAAADVFKFSGGSNNMALSLEQENIMRSMAPLGIGGLFSGLKQKVRRIFCQIVGALNGDSTLDAKKIIKAVLTALIPAIGAAAGLLPIAITIVVSLAAMLLKYGVGRVCPV